MAKAPKGEPEGDAPPPKKSKLLLIILMVMVFILLLVGIAVGLLLWLKSDKSEEATTAEGDKPPAAVATEANPAVPAPPTGVNLAAPPTFVKLDKFTVNLKRDTSDHYLQAEIVLRVATAENAGQLEGFMPLIRNRVNLILSSKTATEVATVEGREMLAHQILEAINQELGFPAPRDSRPGGPPYGVIHGVLFNSFIIQ